MSLEDERMQQAGILESLEHREDALQEHGNAKHFRCFPFHVCLISIQVCEESSLCTYSATSAFNKVKYYILRLLFIKGIYASLLFPAS